MDNQFYQQLCDQEKILTKKLEELKQQVNDDTETLGAIRTLKKRFPSTAPVKNSGTVNKLNLKVRVDKSITKYNSEQTQFQKTFVALFNIRKGFATDIAKELHRLDPKEFTEDKAYKVAREKASDLYQQDVFDIEKFGRKYKYSIKSDVA